MRDFEKEYKNYINEEVPDLWDRIESGLDVKKDRNESGQKKILYLMKRSMPAVAALCVLLIGFGAIRMSNRSNGAASVYEESTELIEEEPACEAAYEDYDEAVAEAVADAAGEPAEDAGVSPAMMQDAETNAAYGTAESAETVKNSAATAGSNADAETLRTDEEDPMQSIDGMIVVKGAMLTGIVMADADLQDEGFVYVYRFRLADGDEMEVYLTQSQCDELEKSGMEIKRQTKYDLDVKPYDDKTDFAKCILINIKEN